MRDVRNIIVGALVMAGLSFGGWTYSQFSEHESRIRVNNRTLELIEKRLDRIEGKLDKVIQNGRYSR